LLKFGLMLGGKGQHKPYIFTPADLFFLGEKGAYYSPSDISTLFQDEAGTVPVTADGDPVGLAVDKIRQRGRCSAINQRKPPCL